MSMLSIGDLAQSFLMRRQNLTLKQQIDSLTLELASGRKSDVSRAIGGDYSYLADINRSMQVLEGYDLAIVEAGGFTQTMQDTFSRVQGLTSDLGSRLVSASASHISSVLSVASGTARQDFGTLITALNTGVAGRSLFSGAATDTAPLISADDILNRLRTEVASETTLSGVLSKIDDWFYTTGGDFEAFAYLGSSQRLAQFQLSENDSVQFSMKADDKEIRDLLRNAAIGALSADETLGFAGPLQNQLQQEAGESLLSAQDGLVKIRADLGYVQERVDDAKAHNTIAASGLEQARNDLLSADPYETASRLENAQFQLESLYTLTVRMSHLTLMDFMK